MAYDLKLADRIREAIYDLSPQILPGCTVEEKKMMGGLTFMVNDKMCVGIFKDDMMVRIDPQIYEEVLERPGCREMDFTNRPMIGFVYVSNEGMKTKKDFFYWISLALEYNKKAKPSKKRQKKSK